MACNITLSEQNLDCRDSIGGIVKVYALADRGDITAIGRSELTLVFHKMDTSKRLEISALAIGNMAMIAEDANGKCWFLGKDEPVTMASGQSQTGVAKGDKNGYDCVLACEGRQEPWEVTAAAMATLLA